MSKCRWLGGNVKLFSAVTVSLLLAACVTTIPFKPAFDEPPLATRIHARVGSACRIPIHAADYAETPGGGGIAKVDFDQASLSRFAQVFDSLFTEVTPLAPWPPWRESPPDLDAVIELDEADLKLSLGDDMNRNPEHVAVRYRVCLYTPDGTTINCWETQAEQIHQRQPFERSLSLTSYLGTLVETASREAMARFMLAFEADPAVKVWVDHLARRQEEP